MNEIRLSQPPIQKKITTDHLNYDIFSHPSIAADLLARYHMTSDSITKTNVIMDVTVLPDTPCTVIWNGYESDAPSYFTTRGFVSIGSLKIKETGISALISIQIP